MRHILRLFPNVQHVALSSLVPLVIRELSKQADASAPCQLESLHAYVNQLQDIDGALHGEAVCQLRCLSLRWDTFVLTDFRVGISNTLTLLPHLQQLAITGGMFVSQRYDLDLETLPSLFRNVQLSQLTYLQFTGVLFPADIDHLLSLTSPPTFAASLTHLALTVRWSDVRRAAASLHLLPAIYPSLQRCHVELTISNYVADGVPEEWRAAVDGLRVRLGAVWCESEAAVREARCDVAWRRSAGLPDVADKQLGFMTEEGQPS